MKKKKQEHMAYPFFSYGEGSDRKFAIPGSSIRGELRSVFEAATDSCMSTLRPDTKLSRRVDCRYPIWAGIAEQVSKIDGKDSRVSKKATGYVYVGEMFAMKKHGESIFQCKEEVKNIGTEELEHTFRDLLETLEIYQDTGINKTKGHSGYKALGDVMGMQAIPLWYSPDNGKISLSLASLGRDMYETSLNELVGTKAPCEKKQHLCEACALFRMAAQEDKFGSRIRFTDALAIGECETQTATISVLGQPRYSYLSFYEKNNADSYDASGAEISGKKFYWHNLKAATDDSIYKMTEKNQFNSTMELVMSETEKPLLEFTVYYDGITKKQLDRLIWCINFGDNTKEGKMAHKIGHRKPLGLGSVKFIITEHRERIFTNDQYNGKMDSLLCIGQRINVTFKEQRDGHVNFYLAD